MLDPQNTFGTKQRNKQERVFHSVTLFIVDWELPTACVVGRGGIDIYMKMKLTKPSHLFVSSGNIDYGTAKPINCCKLDHERCAVKQTNPQDFQRVLF